jgi:hypothetical protein
MSTKDEAMMLGVRLSLTAVSRSLLSERNLERCANLYAEQEKSAYTNDYYGYYNGAKQMGNAIVDEIKRRQQLIMSEPNGIVRETMINDLLVGLQ